MTIKNKKHKEQLRTEFAVFLARNRFNLMSFLTSYNDEVNEIMKRKGSIIENYKVIYNRLKVCVNIDLDFIQKLIEIVDKTQKVQVIRDQVKIGKPF